MAAGALQLVGHRSGFVDIFADAEGWLLHLVIDASAQRHAVQSASQMEGLVGRSDRRIAELEIDPGANEEDHEGEEEAKEKFQEPTRTACT